MVLETPRLALRAWTLDDAPAFLAIYGDPRVTKFTTMPPIGDIAAARMRLERLIEQIASRGIGHWALVERSTGELVGSCGFRPSDSDDELEVGFTVAPSRWGFGYATEAAAACVRYGFARGASKVIALTMPANASARRVLEKVGMRHTGEIVDDGATWCTYEMQK